MYVTSIEVLNEDYRVFNSIKYDSLYIAEELHRILKMFYDLDIRVEGYITELKENNIYKFKYPFYFKLKKLNYNLNSVLEDLTGQILTCVYKPIEDIFIDINLKEVDNIEIFYKE